MAYRLAQANFSKGELAPALHGRFDVESYSSAAKKVRNAFVLKYGGLSKRPGTRLVAEVLDAENDVRLIPFQFSLDQSYALEMRSEEHTSELQSLMRIPYAVFCL